MIRSYFTEVRNGTLDGLCFVAAVAIVLFMRTCRYAVFIRDVMIDGLICAWNRMLDGLLWLANKVMNYCDRKIAEAEKSEA